MRKILAGPRVGGNEESRRKKELHSGPPLGCTGLSVTESLVWNYGYDREYFSRLGINVEKHKGRSERRKHCVLRLMRWKEPEREE